MIEPDAAVVEQWEMFPDRLHMAREARGWSQNDLAHQAGLHASQVSHFEAGNREPSMRNLRKLAQSLHVSADFLLGLESEMQPPKRVLKAQDHIVHALAKLRVPDYLLAQDIITLLLDRAALNGSAEEEGA